MNRPPSPQSSWQRRYFSLVEILVAMTILVLVVFGLFRVIQSTASIWREQRIRVDIYSSAQLFFDLVKEDLKGIPRLDTGHSVWAPNTTDYDLVLVTGSGIGAEFGSGSTADSNEYMEVAYVVDNHRLYRARSSTSDAQYNWLNNDTGTWGNVFADFADSDLIIAGIRSFSIDAYTADDSLIESDSNFSNFTEAPAYFDIQMEIFAEEAINAPDSVINESLRYFHKRVYTSHSTIQ